MSDLAVLLIDSVVKGFVMVLGLAGGFAYTTVLERRLIARFQDRLGPNRAGPWGLLQPIADAFKVFFKEDIVPDRADKVLFTVAPAITIIPALVVLAVVPFGGRVNFFGYDLFLGVADINVGVLYILSVTSIAVYGIVLAGWSSANKYAMLGGIRATAQMIAYELSMGLSMLSVVMVVGSMSIGDIINAQSRVWMVFLQPVAAIIFIITIFAETNRGPFDMPEAEQELTAGYHTEYSGMKFAGFFMAEYIKMIAMSAIAAAFFFGGFRFFGLENWLGGWMGPLILLVKIIFGLAFFIWVRATIPRVRYDQLMAFGWKFLLPLSLANVAVTMVLVALNVFPTLI